MERRNKWGKMVQDIPDDVILDIFSRLPDKSLVQVSLCLQVMV
jgi:hypothetical protein